MTAYEKGLYDGYLACADRRDCYNPPEQTVTNRTEFIAYSRGYLAGRHAYENRSQYERADYI